MSIQERFIRYCKIDSQSNDASETCPSTSKQFELARLLEKEMVVMGMENVVLDESCYLYGEIPSNTDKETLTIGFIAHLDTAPDFSGENVNPKIIENYDGKDIELGNERVLSVTEFESLENQIGNDIIVTDGNTLLGADDKAGIAEIMEACSYLLNNPDVKHGTIKVAFTPDEEIGRGANLFNVEAFGCDFAYTMDGSSVYEYSDETFNAASATVNFVGKSIHPGSAKGKMIHAANIANEYHALLPKKARAETTEGKEGFNHLISMSGDVSNAQLKYILRNHDQSKLSKQKELLSLAKDLMNKRYGDNTVSLEISDSYNNMKEILSVKTDAVDYALKAYSALGMNYTNTPVRGGTDGARLTFMNLPCPNLGTGGYNFHGPYEYCSIQEMELAVKLILKIIEEVSS
ncbi:MAG: peptidase T [Anaerorhabdus sp.]